MPGPRLGRRDIDCFVQLGVKPVAAQAMHRGNLFAPTLGFWLEVDDAAKDLLAILVGDGEAVIAQLPLHLAMYPQMRYSA